MPLEQVHLHEVGALDSIIDIVGAVFALEWFGADRVVVLAAERRRRHGALGARRVPGAGAGHAAAARRRAGLRERRCQCELVTPTGALLAHRLRRRRSGRCRRCASTAIGYGAGDRDLPEHAERAARAGRRRRPTAAPADAGRGDRACEIDDMNPQIFGALMDRLYAAGALEVFYAPVQMKKNRPGTLLTVVVPPGRPRGRSPTSSSARRRPSACATMRWSASASTARPCRWRRRGARSASRWRGAAADVLNAAPEFDDCARLAADARRARQGRPRPGAKAWLDRKS